MPDRTKYYNAGRPTAFLSRVAADNQAGPYTGYSSGSGATNALAAALGVPAAAPGPTNAQLMNIIKKQSEGNGLLAGGLQTGKNIAVETNRYQPPQIDRYEPTAGLRRLGQIFSGMGTTPGASFASDLIGSGQRLSAQDQAGALRNRAEQAARQKAATAAKLLEMQQAYKDRAEGRDIEALDLRKEAAARDKFPKAPAITKAAIQGMEDYIDAMELDFSILYSNWNPLDPRPRESTVKSTIARTALDLQTRDPELRGNTEAAIRQAVAILSDKGAAPATPAAGSIQNIQNLTFSK